MKKLSTIKLLLVSLFMLSFPVQTQAQAAQRIKFQRGTYSKTVSGTVGKNQQKRYVLGLSRNQKLTVEFPDRPQDIFITIKDGKGNTLEKNRKFSAEITTAYNGDYYIVISTQFGQADSFTFRVEAK